MSECAINLNESTVNLCDVSVNSTNVINTLNDINESAELLTLLEALEGIAFFETFLGM